MARLILVLGTLFVVTSVGMIFLFIGVGLVPYWGSLEAEPLQAWFAGPFVRFSTLMVPLHLASIVLMGASFMKRGTQELGPWLLAVSGLALCQLLNFMVYGPWLNPDLQSQGLDHATALSTFATWSRLHAVRTAGALASALALCWILARER